MNERFTSEALKERRDPSTFVDTMMRLDETYQLGLHPGFVAMAADGEWRIQHSKDVSHDQDHVVHLGADVALILKQYPELRDRIDWNALVAAVAFHDISVAELDPRPWNLWLAQNREHTFAARPAVDYMRAHGFSGEQIDSVSYLITTHPLAFDDPLRKSMEMAVDEMLRLTGRLLYVVDALDVYRPSRIDAMVAHISDSFWGMPMMPFYPVINKYFTRNSNFSFDLGPQYPWVAQEAARRKAHATAYIDDLLKTKRDVRPSVAAWRQ